MTPTMNVPGPGTYTAMNFVGKEGFYKTMGANLNWAPHAKEDAGKPGPGSYDANCKIKFLRKP